MKTLLALSACATILLAQQPAAQSEQQRLTSEDHKNMMAQLGIKALRPGPSGTETAPNHANYDEATANPFPLLPDVLTLKNGKKVTNADQWKQRRAEIIEDFDREVLGRVPKNAPKVTWTVSKTVNGSVGAQGAIGKQLVGHLDNIAYPGITVDIEMTVVTPANAKEGRPGDDDVRARRAAAGSWRTASCHRKARAGPNADLPATQQLLAAGWGYAYLNPTSVRPTTARASPRRDRFGQQGRTAQAED